MSTIVLNSNNMKTNKHKSESKSVIVYRTVVYIVLTIITLLCLFPFYILLINCTRNTVEIRQGFSWWFGKSFVNNWNAMINDKENPVLKALLNSTIVALSAATLTVYFSALTAYATHIYNFKGKKIITTFILAIMMIPTQVASLGLVLICLKIPGMKDSFLPIIIPAVASPITYFYMKQYLASVLPYEVIEAARVDGDSEIGIFHKIVLPIIKPALAVQFIFAFVSNWNNYFLPAMLINSRDKKTIPLIIANLKASNPQTLDLGKIYLTMTIAVFPLLIVYLIFSRAIIKGLTSGAVKG